MLGPNITAFLTRQREDGALRVLWPLAFVAVIATVALAAPLMHRHDAINSANNCRRSMAVLSPSRTRLKRWTCRPSKTVHCLLAGLAIVMRRASSPVQAL